MKDDRLSEKILQLIKKNPGIRPKDLNAKLGMEHSWNVRSVLIKQGLIKKEKDGVAVRYYPVKM